MQAGSPAGRPTERRARAAAAAVVSALGDLNLLHCYYSCRRRRRRKGREEGREEEGRGENRFNPSQTDSRSRSRSSVITAALRWLAGWLFALGLPAHRTECGHHTEMGAGRRERPGAGTATTNERSRSSTPRWTDGRSISRARMHFDFIAPLLSLRVTETAAAAATMMMIVTWIKLHFSE